MLVNIPLIESVPLMSRKALSKLVQLNHKQQILTTFQVFHFLPTFFLAPVGVVYRQGPHFLYTKQFKEAELEARKNAQKIRISSEEEILT